MNASPKLTQRAGSASLVALVSAAAFVIPLGLWQASAEPGGGGSDSGLLNVGALLAAAAALVGASASVVTFAMVLAGARAKPRTLAARGPLAVGVWLLVAAPIVATIFNTTGFVETAVVFLTGSLAILLIIPAMPDRFTRLLESVRALSPGPRRVAFVLLAAVTWASSTWFFSAFGFMYFPVHLTLLFDAVVAIGVLAVVLDVGPRVGGRTLVAVLAAGVVGAFVLLSVNAGLWASIAVRRAVTVRALLESLADLAPDRDGDGHPAAWGSNPLADCDDSDPNVHPLAADLPGDGIDGNCFGGDVDESARVWRDICRSRATRCEKSDDVEPAEPRNIVLLGIDAWRYDAGHPGGVDPAVMPFIASLVDRSLVVEDYRSCASSTPAAIEQLLSGFEYRYEVGGHKSVPALLRAEHGYTTQRLSTFLLKSDSTGAWDGGFTDEDRQRLGLFPYDADIMPVVRRVLSDTARPFLAHLHLMELHGPRKPIAPCKKGDDPLAIYRCAQPIVDARVRELFEVLNTAHGEDGVVVVLYGDHGEGLAERGPIAHGYGLFEELVRTPLLFVDGRRKREVTTPAGCADVMTTVLDLAGVCAPAVRGASLASGAHGADRPQTFAMAWPGLSKPVMKLQLGVLLDDVKLVYDALSAGLLAYDLAADPGEHAPKPGHDAQTVGELDAWLSLFFALRQGQDLCAP